MTSVLIDLYDLILRPLGEAGLDSLMLTELVLSRGHEYLRRTTGVPTTYHRIKHGDELQIGKFKLTYLER